MPTAQNFQPNVYWMASSSYCSRLPTYSRVDDRVEEAVTLCTTALLVNVLRSTMACNDTLSLQRRGFSPMGCGHLVWPLRSRAPSQYQIYKLPYYKSNVHKLLAKHQLFKILLTSYFLFALFLHALPLAFSSISSG